MVIDYLCLPFLKENSVIIRTNDEIIPTKGKPVEKGFLIYVLCSYEQTTKKERNTNVRRSFIKT